MSWLFGNKPFRWLGLTFDRSLSIEDVHRLLVSVIATSSLGSVVLEVERGKDGCEYRVGTHQPARMEALLAVFLPGVTVQPVARLVGDVGSTWVVRSNTDRRSLMASDPEASTHRLLGAIALKGAIHQIVIGQRLRPTAIPVEAAGFRSESVVGSMAEAVWSGPQRFDGELRRAMADKQGVAGARVWMRLLVPGDRSRSIGAVSNYSAAMRSLESAGLRLRLTRTSWRSARVARPGWWSPLSLNVEELGAVLAWPYGERTYSGVDRSGSRLLPISSTNGERILGAGTHPASTKPIGLSATDGLRHMWTMGPTGVGKSTLLENLALQDIAAGRGAVVIDPKGDLVEGILGRVRASDLDRIVVLDPGRTDQMIGFNPLAVPPEEIELAVDGVLHVLRSINADSWGPRTQDVLHASLLTLAGSEHATLVAIPQLLLDDRFRRRLTGSSMPHGLRGFWSWYEALSVGERASVIAPVLNKIRPFTMRSSLRAMLGQTKPLFDLRSIYTERKVLLVPLRKGVVGSGTANLLGSLIVARVWQLAQGRSALRAEERSPVFAYLDEFQEYLRLPTDFTGVLTQARGLGLGLVLAHQHLKQLSPSVQAAVSANAQSTVMFRLGSGDAETMARSAPGLEAADFTSLPAFSAYINVLVDGQSSGYGSITTAPPRRVVRSAERVARKLARAYGVSPTSVDAGLYGSEKSAAEVEESPIGVKKRSTS